MTSESERVTRKKRIDPQLKAAGWVISPSRTGMDLSRCNRYALEEFPTGNGPADYALCLDGKIVAVIEAKKVTLGPQNVLTGRTVHSRDLRRPVQLFRVPGSLHLFNQWRDHCYHDLRNPLNRSRTVAKFHTPDALAERLKEKFEASCQRLLEWENAHPMIRPYQAEANAAIEQAIRDRKRQMLLRWRPGPARPTRW